MKVFLAGLIAAETDGVVTDERRFPGRQGRLLFAYLVAEEGRAVPRDELAEALWGEHPPATWDKALSVLVSKLRGLLAEHGIDGARALTGAFGCYRLELPEGTWIDVVVAAEAAEEAERELASGDLEGAKDAATLAESLVRQPFLPGDDGTWVDEKRRELADVRVRALSVLADACRRSGDAREAARWAEQAIALEPFRESGYRRLMEAHAAAGDGAEALRVYERCRRLLAEELGAFPSPETESIYRALLEAPPAPTEAGGLDVPTREAAAALHPETEARESARRVPPWKPIGAAAAVGAVVAAAAAGLLAIGGGETQAAVAANSAVALDPSGSIAAIVPVGARPVAVAAGSGSIWVANSVDHSVTRVDLSSREAVRAIAIGGTPSALAATRSGVWVTDGAGRVSRIDVTYDRVSSTRRLAASASGFFGPSAPRPMLSRFGSIWIVDPDGFVSRIDPDSGRSLGSVDVGNDPSAIAAGAGSVWVTNRADGTVTRIDPTTLVTTTIPVGHGPAAVAVNAAGAWVANAGDGTLVRVDTGTNAVAATTQVGDAPTAVLATPAALWVAGGRDGTVERLDPRSGHVSKTIRLGGMPDALAAAAGKVWVTIAPAPPPPPAAGGTARLTLQDDLPSYDPAISVSPQVLYATCAEPGHLPGQTGARGIDHRSRGCRGRSRADRSGQDLHVQDPSRFPLLAAVERAGDGDDVRVDDRTADEPAPEVAVREPVQRHRRLSAPTSAGRRGTLRASSPAVARSRSGCRSRTAASWRTLRRARRAPSRAGPRHSRAGSTTSPLRARTTSRRTRPASSSCSLGIRTTTVSGRIVSTGS